jgi:hypothetical protein
MQRKADWAKRLNRIHYAKGSKRAKRQRITDENRAVGLQSLSVTRWQKAPYPKDDAESDILGAMIANDSADPQQALDSLNKRPFAYSAPEPIVGQPEQEYCELCEQLADCADNPKVGRILRESLIGTGALPSRADLTLLAGCSEWQARAALDTIQTVVLRVFTIAYIDERRAERATHCSKKTTYSEDRLLANLTVEALTIDDTPSPLAENDLPHLERQLVDNLLSAGCVALVPIVSALVRGDCDALASAIERLPIAQPAAPDRFQPAPGNPLGFPPCAFDFYQRNTTASAFADATAAWNHNQAKRAGEQVREVVAKRERLEGTRGTIAQQYRARYDRAVWELNRD